MVKKLFSQLFFVSSHALKKFVLFEIVRGPLFTWKEYFTLTKCVQSMFLTFQKAKFLDASSTMTCYLLCDENDLGGDVEQIARIECSFRELREFFLMLKTRALARSRNLLQRMDEQWVEEVLAHIEMQVQNDANGYNKRICIKQNKSPYVKRLKSLRNSALSYSLANPGINFSTTYEFCVYLFKEIDLKWSTQTCSIQFAEICTPITGEEMNVTRVEELSPTFTLRQDTCSEIPTSSSTEFELITHEQEDRLESQKTFENEWRSPVTLCLSPFSTLSEDGA